MKDNEPIDDVVSDLELFRSPAPKPGEPGYLTPDEMDEDWQRLQERIGLAGKEKRSSPLRLKE